MGKVSSVFDAGFAADVGGVAGVALRSTIGAGLDAVAAGAAGTAVAGAAAAGRAGATV
jgi:hypothetical protein